MTATATPDQDLLAIRISRVHEHAPWGRTTTFRLVREGVLPVKRLGGMSYVLREDLHRVLRDAPIVASEVAAPPV